MGGGGQLEQGTAPGLHVGPELCQQLRVLHNVHLVGRHQHPPRGQLGGPPLQLLADGVEIRHRVPALGAGHVHHMDEQAAAVDVPEEVVAQPRAVGGPLNDAGDIRQDEGLPLLHGHHPQVGGEGGEVVVGDLGLGPGNHAEQGGLAHVGEAHQPHVRQQLQLQHHVPALSGQAGLGEPGHLTGGGGEVLVAPAPPAPPAQDEPVGLGHVLNDLLGFGVPDNCAPGDTDDQVLPVPAGTPLARAVGPAARRVCALVAKIHQGGHMVVDLHHDVAAPAAVAPVFLPVEGHHAVAPVPGADGDLRCIYKGCCHVGHLLTVMICYVCAHTMSPRQESPSKK